MLRIFIAVFAVWLVGAASAHAEATVARAQVGAVQFAGRSVVYEERTFTIESAEAVDYADRIVRRHLGHSPRVVGVPAGSFDTIYESTSDDLRWDASAAGLLTGVGSTDYQPADVVMGAEVSGGAFGQRPTRFANCFENASGTPSVAVSGKLAAYTNDCSSDNRPLLVRRLDRPHDPALFRREIGPGEIDLAGNYVAVAYSGDSRGSIEVYDWRDGTSLYRVAANLAYSQSFELQEDGKLAAVLDHGAYCEAAWFSPAEPSAHVVGRAACEASVRLSADQLAWVRRARTHAELVVTPLGTGGRTVARFPASPPRAGDEPTMTDSFAWDGQRLAYAVRRCDGRAQLFLRRHIAGPVFRDSDPRSCPLRVAGRVLHLKRGSKSVGVPLRCPRGCAGTMQVRGGHPSIDEPFALRPGRRYARLFLTDNTRLSLARHGSARIHLRIYSGGRAGGSTERDVRLRLYTR